MMSPARMSLAARHLGWYVLVLLLFLGLPQHGTDASRAPDTPGPAGPISRSFRSSPELLRQNITWTTTGNAAIVPGQSWSGTYSVRPIWTYQYEFVDSFFLDGPLGWTVASITSAPLENTGDGLKTGQAFQNPAIELNTSARAHVYWGFDPLRTPINYVNGPVISPPTRSNEDNKTGKGVYLAAPHPGGPERVFGITYDVPESWSQYLCPGAVTPHEFIGLSGNAADPNFLQATLYSSGSDGGAVDALFAILLPCRQPQVGTTLTGTVQSMTGSAGGEGTMTVRYCMTTTNSSPNVYLGGYAVSSESIGYSETRVVTLAPGAFDTVCAPDHTYDVVWPPAARGCVTNSSGSMVTAETPVGWGEQIAGQPENGFAQRTFAASASAGVGLETCATPASVALASLSAERHGDGVVLAWETVSERDNLGFNVYRADAANGAPPDPGAPDWKRLNSALIPATDPGSGEGHAYVWLDATASSDELWYLLEDVDAAGRTERHGPVSTPALIPNSVRLVQLEASPLSALRLGVLAVLAGAWLVLSRGTVISIAREICHIRQK